jgi:hypothetical protein
MPTRKKWGNIKGVLRTPTSVVVFFILSYTVMFLYSFISFSLFLQVAIVASLYYIIRASNRILSHKLNFITFFCNLITFLYLWHEM